MLDNISQRKITFYFTLYNEILLFQIETIPRVNLSTFNQHFIMLKHSLCGTVDYSNAKLE